MNKRTVAVLGASIMGAALLLGLGAAAGYTLGTASTTASSDTPDRQPSPCNLWFPQGEVPAVADEDSVDVRIANPACSDAQIIAWQDQQQSDGLDNRVCRPLSIDPLTRTPLSCVVPTEVDVEYR
ncbi:hypothetical protein [Microbacterium maritypicum]|uniref:Uncharacterized protein n=1 Tax=Microbacterium maritypicum MF109 TaxID=1333857 RepID=T5KS80_MICMQ|nr:hypothetical protein [Microbacterium liquefaciens]EQM81871.1 hypothetical protein L687_00500 [Microbacterium maritypicum MF109]